MAGPSYEIVVLSSSPPAHDLYAPSSPLNGSPRSSPRRVAMPASPLLTLSPPVSPRKKTSGASAPASRKASIPPEAIRGFATVGSLVRSEHFAQQLDDDITEKDLAPRRRGSLQDSAEDTVNEKKTRKRSTTAIEVDGEAKPKPKARLRKPKAADQEATTHDPELRLPAPKTSPYFPTEGTETSIAPPTKPADAEPKLTKSGKPRKPRATKEKVEGEDVKSKPRKPRVTKPKANAKAVESVQREDACVESAHFSKAADRGDDSPADRLTTGEPANVDSTSVQNPSIWEIPQSPQPKKKRPLKQQPREPDFESLELDEAVSRRRDWTPPRDTARASPSTASVGKENKELDADADNGGFTHMISNFAYAQSPSAQITATTISSTTGIKAQTKRRRVEVSMQPITTEESRG
jgi:hypothetical protein